ncbi:alternate-type signal peptide domain-containing protein [Leucobacter viscericola]|uniref:Alternate-type signal peptide domain-containing protein n=1 Tax=Leucobacter viscericola TaxID=2714935 RepID=A0A6G7XES1_9MICO|nr:alternate-type signal peptide domain-containing protein [Leucobacter viscericola]QIK63110.1 alternate-type signal peptide domain-containing protein [Leucobacter viscericola]
MNKLTKGAIATAIGTALLLGGGTTLALWNDTVNVGSSQEISSGVLTLDATPGSWSASPELWVPGDSFTYTTQVSIVAQGDNLASELKIDPSSVTGDAALLAALDYSISVSDVTGGTLTAIDDATYSVSPANANSGDPISAKVTVKVDFPADVVTGLVAQGAEAHLSDLQLLLNQVAA